MKLVLQGIGAVVAGLSLAAVFVIGVEWMSSILHPFPPGVDPTDIVACRAHVALCPAAVLLLVILGWGFGVFVSSWLATRVGPGRHPAYGIVVGSILLLLAVTNMAMLPYPGWFWFGNLIAFPICFWFGAKLGRR